MFKRIASTRLRVVAAAAALTVAAFATAAEFNGSHPDSYVVRKGDTLWDISAKFLKKPWLWPEIWQANPQIKNPHLIYPGDVISLAYLNRVAVQPGPRDEAPVNAINLSDIEPFLKDLSIADSYEGLPYVVSIEEDHLRGSAGRLVYVRNLAGAQPGQRYSVVRPSLRYTQTRLASNAKYLGYTEDLDWRGKRLKGDTVDWDRQWTSAALMEGPMELLGYELSKVSTGTVTRTGGDVTSVLLDDEYRDVRPGDRLVPVQAQPYDLQFFPHAPRSQPPVGKLQIAAVAHGMLYGGNHDVV
ncbi:MAG TPA: LysM domain-containing protein, partial [Pseudoxanthomonas sp.]|nr:LysM domain-containing protein [Pseudoxanthomonas sp.]